MRCRSQMPVLGSAAMSSVDLSVPFLDALNTGALVADGAMGTQIYERGVVFNVNYEELNLSRPELVRQIHEAYLHAGAQVLETNTFGANQIRLSRHGLDGRVREINTAAVKIAQEATGGTAYIAGAMGPTGLSSLGVSGEERERAVKAFREQASALVEAGVHLLLIETMHWAIEAELALRAARMEAPDIPIIVQVSPNDRGELDDGERVSTTGRRLLDLGATGLGLNCSVGPQIVLDAAEELIRLGAPLSVMPNAGLPHKVDDRLIYVSTPDYFARFARRFYKLGVKLVGGCCGTTPEHIKKIAGAARMEASTSQQEDQREERPVAEIGSLPPPPQGVSPVPQEQKSKLAAKLGKRFVVSVEVNPPIGLDLSRALEAARMLTSAGIDVINIADGARAQARMGNLALAVEMQQKLGVESILHVCGRDRNLLAQLAHLLSAHALGLRNLVIITGDPPRMGGFPDATPVYDLDSVGLLRLASGLNRGLDPGGRAMGMPTSFLLATGAEPAAINYERELQRLRNKKAAGAELVMTQPVYNPVILEKFLDDIAPLDLPVLVGLLPLASHRNAEFLHNEVPGMQIPEEIRERMRKAGSGPAARKEGVAIAREMLTAVRHRVAGAYIMPPLERYELALEVVDGFLEP